MVNKASDGGPADFSGIDPAALQGMIRSFKNDGAALRSAAARYKEEFAAWKMDTQPLTQLIAHADWMHDQVPLLERRHNLAVGMDRPRYEDTHLVMVYESLVTKASLTEASQDGKALADEFAGKMDQGDPLPDGCFEALSANAGDGDFLKAFYQEFGPKRTSWLASNLSTPVSDRYLNHPEVQTQDRLLLAQTLGTYTQVAFADKPAARQKSAWSAWLTAFGTGTGPDGFRSDLITPLLEGGTQSTAFLVALGDKVFDKKYLPQGGADDPMLTDPDAPEPWGGDHYAQFFNALAKDPEASGEWFDDRHDVANAMLYIPSTSVWQLHQPKGRATAFFKVAHAATIGLRATDEPLAEKITARMLVDHYLHAKNPKTAKVHPVAGTDTLYAQIIADYWDDLVYSVTSPVGNQLVFNDIRVRDAAGPSTKWDDATFRAQQDPRRRGLEVSPVLREQFVGESARDPAAAGDLSALFQAYDGDMNDRIGATRADRQNGKAYLNLEQARMQSFYTSSFGIATASLQTDLDDWAQRTNERREQRLELAYGTATGMLTDGPAGATDAVKEFGTDLLNEDLMARINAYGHVDPEDAPKPLRDRFAKVSDDVLDFAWQTNYRNKVSSSRSHHMPITPVVVHGPDGTRRYTGDPHGYITSPADDFLDRHGVPLTSMTPRQRTAYEKWLRDPAVVNSVYADFDELESGKSY